MKRVRQVVAGGLTSALILSVMAAPALATHNKTVPADECAPAEAGNPGANGESVDAILTKGVVFQEVQVFPIGNVTKAPTECPAPQK